VLDAYKAKYGEFTSPEMEPSTDQLAAVQELLDGGQPPYVDFAVFGTHERRALRKLTDSAFQYNAIDGSWKRRELDGPSSFPQWWKSWLVFRCNLMLLQAALPERFGHDRWFLIYQGDVRMRSERTERLRRNMHELTQGRFPEYSPTHPWGYMLQAAAQDRDFWDDEVRTPCLLYAARGAAANTHPRGRNMPTASVQPKRQRTGAHAAQSGGGGGPGREVCHNWNRGACQTPCPQGHIQKCLTCGGDHPREQCRGKPDKAERAERFKKGKGRCKGKGKGKAASS
jgi:hypothetical protein